MEKITQKDFTFGFELEGLFSPELVRSLQREHNASKLEILELKDDGSVSVDDYHFEPAEDKDGNTIREIAVGIFQDLDTMKKCLSRFINGVNYDMNKSCGLHIHIKPKDKRQELRGMCFDKDFILKLEQYSGVLCEHIADRVANNYYCKPEFTFRRLLRKYQNREKYSFMGNHPQGTIEFRFFSACRHKSQNVEKFFDYFLEQLNLTQARVFGKRTGLKEKINLVYTPCSFSIYPASRKINITEDMKYNKKLKICV